MLNEINFRSIDIIKESSCFYGYATFETVHHILLQRYNLLHFEQFGIGSFMQVPPLKLLFEINCKVFYFIFCSFNLLIIFELVF
jgi:hypothetical protein